ncbi:MAG: hypothetical protein COX81_01890 [Candidatus Magasanikbacteria bacterium CG_4_10_14_0_2_um_filter_37_12]|uniref:Sortilin N-terminal domain-containing protein n=1 Tax=Candidatus Magasanikbacteria bacterium CG_4_10_14_0_2_um_filter_37_12 TaxID=1974637 RepID=A0A2M7V8G3_9BACT|nr:MAG: hypothetical protein COX81_01890 [Candidatus Magasanikbacteria bacterium CG_4_10_14_0_2_um_filter_37_12]
MTTSFLKLILVVALPLLLGAGCLSISQSNGVETSGPGGMFVSVDKGESWQPISTKPTAQGVQNISNVSVYRLIPDLQDTKTMYWLSREQGLFYTYDDGKTWQQASSPLSSGFVYSIAIHPEDVCTVYATDGSHVYKSIDCNRTWEEVYRESRTSAGIRALLVNPFSPYQILLAETNGDLLQSFDLGKSWSVSKRFKSNIVSLIADPAQPGVIYLITKSQGLYRSSDGGLTWNSLVEGLKKYSKATEFRYFYIHPNKKDTLYWISTYGILVSKDGGVNWDTLSLITPPGSAQIYSFAINPENDREIYYTATINNRSTFYRSIDGGSNWITRKMPSGQIPTALRVHPERSELLYLGFTIPPKE